MAKTRAEIEKLEDLLDKMGVQTLFEALGEIADEKSGHVMEAWQDRNLANRWSKLARKLEKLSATIDDPYYQ